MSQLQSDTEFSTITVQKHIESLIQLGLLTEERETSFPRKRHIMLSNEGKRAAKMMAITAETSLGASDLIEIGAKAGRIASYQESIAYLRSKSPSKELLTATLLIKGIEALSSSLALLTKMLPKDYAEQAATIELWSKKMQSHSVEGYALLNANNLSGGVDRVMRALNEFGGAHALLEGLSKRLRENNMEELANFVDFVKPKQTQKE